MTTIYGLFGCSIIFVQKKNTYFSLFGLWVGRVVGRSFFFSRLVFSFGTGIERSKYYKIYTPIDDMVGFGGRIYEANILIKGIKKEYETALEQCKAEMTKTK